MFARLRALVRALTARRAFEAGLTEELRFHIEQYTEDLVRSGVSPEEARRRARMELGGINTVKEDCREARGLGGLDALERECRALTVVLLAATGLLIRTLIGLQTIPPGFNPTGVILMPSLS
jgi:hypothetical protein